MQPIKIFVEGKADECFIRQYVEHVFQYTLLKNDIIICNGVDNLMSQANMPIYQHNLDDGGANIVIADADDNASQRRNDILKTAQDTGIDMQLFLMPDDNSPGALENLLMKIINPVNQPIVDCWDLYEKGLSQISLPWKKPPTPTLPALKTKVYAYLEALVGTARTQKSLIKEEGRNYRNPNHWNLDADALLPLKAFLAPFFAD